MLKKHPVGAFCADGMLFWGIDGKEKGLLFDQQSCVGSHGGVERIRTSAPVAQPNDLANRPLQPLEYHSIMAERVGFEPTVP